MSQPTRRRWLKKLAITAIGKPLARDFDRASRNLQGTQEGILKRTIEECRDTAFGKDHGFARIKSLDDYRKAVPIRDFEGHRPYVDRCENGESDILFPGRPLFYNSTSGTTRKPKLVPVSRRYFEEGYKKISRLWLYTCMRDNPRLFHGKNLSAVGAAEEGTVADGTPCGSLSGAVYKNIPGILKDVYSAPYPVMCIKDYACKYYALVRFSLAEDITYIIAANPSSLLRFHAVVMEKFDDLVRDIRDGTLRKDVVDAVPADCRQSVVGGLRADPERARCLETLMKTHGYGLRPRHYWPNTVCVNTWKQGNCAQVLPQLEGYYAEGTAIREFGYQASEGRAGVVLGNDWECSALTVHVYHFEFIESCARERSDPPVLGAHELEVGKQYYILITNTSGLYRYDINDLIGVVGKYNEVPLFRFMRKGDGFTSLMGEKLTETHVMEAVDEVRKKQALAVPNFTLCCDEIRMCYKFFVEFPSQTSAERKQVFLEEVDSSLKSINPEYDAKRASGRLAMPVLSDLPVDSYERLKNTMVSRGLAREGQYKVMYLQRNAQVLQLLEELSGQA